MQANVNIINLDKFKDTVLYSITIRRWGNSARIRDMAKLEAYMNQLKVEIAQDPTDGNGKAAAVFVASDRVKSSKTLIRSTTYERLCSAMNALKKKSESLAMPSFVRPGMFIVKQSKVLEVENMLKEGWKAIQENELKDFLAAFDADVEYARTAPVKKGGLGPLFNEADYQFDGGTDGLKNLFSIEWFWTALSVPENIPDSLKAEANEKFKRRMEDAAQQIEQALRVELLELVSHAEERLSTAPGEKPKVFRDSMVANVIQFLNTFESRDIFGDDRLAEVVMKARKVMVDSQGNAALDAQKLRDYASVRAAAKEAFSSLKTELSGLIEEQGRKLDLTED